LKIVVVEVGRPIQKEVREQLGEPFKVISYPRPILEDETPRIAVEVYNAIREASRDGEIVYLVLSGTLALAFQIGQLVGLSHFKVQVYQFSGGRYRTVPVITREMLFQT